MKETTGETVRLNKPANDIFKTPTRVSSRRNLPIHLSPHVTKTSSLQYDIPEQDDIIQLTYEPIVNMTDHKKHGQRLSTSQARVKLCERQESQHRAERVLGGLRRRPE